MSDNPAACFEIYGQDTGRATKFYQAVFGVTLANLETPTPGIEMMALPMDLQAPGALGAGQNGRQQRRKAA